MESAPSPAAMLKRAEESAAWALIPAWPTLNALSDAARGCRACLLWKGATQTVFGEGTVSAELMLVGEAPGDREDIEGHPFVGPAGKLLDRALEEARIDRRKVYVTNVVKHFKFTWRGKRRIHKKPGAEEIAACYPWLRAELDLVKPKALVAMGATAAKALIGRTYRVSVQRGQFVQSDLAPLVTATVHPSSILRAPDDETRHEELRRFVADLRKVAQRLKR